MRNRKNIILYGPHEECEIAAELIRRLVMFADSIFEFANKREDLQKKLKAADVKLVIVLSNGADGMEGVYAVRDCDTQQPIFWFSDDINFAMQSHRLECSYFAIKPLTEDKLFRAMQHCRWTGTKIV